MTKLDDRKFSLNACIKYQQDLNMNLYLSHKLHQIVDCNFFLQAKFTGKANAQVILRRPCTNFIKIYKCRFVNPNGLIPLTILIFTIQNGRHQKIVFLSTNSNSDSIAKFQTN